MDQSTAQVSLWISSSPSPQGSPVSFHFPKASQGVNWPCLFALKCEWVWVWCLIPAKVCFYSRSYTWHSRDRRIRIFFRLKCLLTMNFYLPVVISFSLIFHLAFTTKCCFFFAMTVPIIYTNPMKLTALSAENSPIFGTPPSTSMARLSLIDQSKSRRGRDLL